VGLPLHAYHMQLRLHEARRRLRAGDAIAAVALDLGFADQSHLNRRFKGAFGVAPGAYSASLRAPGLRVLNA
jgi:AraC-like DNA-binding protein